MSFSITVIGKPEAIKKRLAEESARLTGTSKIEFDAVKPAIETILNQQVNNGVVRVNANGHAYQNPGAEPYGTCTVEVTCLGQLAE